jgi:hypothetical protein
MKAKLLAKGFGESFAPIIKWKIIHSMDTIASHNKWDIVHLNVKMAFLNNDLKEMYMFQLEEGFVIGQETNVCKL